MNARFHYNQLKKMTVFQSAKTTSKAKAPSSVARAVIGLILGSQAAWGQGPASGECYLSFQRDGINPPDGIDPEQSTLSTTFMDINGQRDETEYLYDFVNASDLFLSLFGTSSPNGQILYLHRDSGSYSACDRATDRWEVSLELVHVMQRGRDSSYEDVTAQFRDTELWDMRQGGWTEADGNELGTIDGPARLVIDSGTSMPQLQISATDVMAYSQGAYDYTYRLRLHHEADLFDIQIDTAGMALTFTVSVNRDNFFNDQKVDRYIGHLTYTRYNSNQGTQTMCDMLASLVGQTIAVCQTYETERFDYVKYPLTDMSTITSYVMDNLEGFHGAPFSYLSDAVEDSLSPSSQFFGTVRVVIRDRDSGDDLCLYVTWGLECDQSFTQIDATQVTYDFSTNYENIMRSDGAISEYVYPTSSSQCRSDSPYSFEIGGYLVNGERDTFYDSLLIGDDKLVYTSDNDKVKFRKYSLNAFPHNTVVTVLVSVHVKNFQTSYGAIGMIELNFRVDNSCAVDIETSQANVEAKITAFQEDGSLPTKLPADGTLEIFLQHVLRSSSVLIREQFIVQCDYITPRVTAFKLESYRDPSGQVVNLENLPEVNSNWIEVPEFGVAPYDDPPLGYFKPNGSNMYVLLEVPEDTTYFGTFTFRQELSAFPQVPGYNAVYYDITFEVNEPSTDPDPVDPDPVDPDPVDPDPVDPDPVDPEPVDPVDPEPVEPVESDPTDVAEPEETPTDVAGPEETPSEEDPPQDEGESFPSFLDGFEQQGGPQPSGDEGQQPDATQMPSEQSTEEEKQGGDEIKDQAQPEVVRPEDKPTDQGTEDNTEAKPSEPKIEMKEDPPAGQEEAWVEDLNSLPKTDRLKSIPALADSPLAQSPRIETSAAVDLMNSLPADASDSYKQAIFSVIMQTRFDLESDFDPSKATSKPPPRPDLAYEPIEPSGLFSMYFNGGIAGLDVLAQIEVEVKSRGRISETVYADQVDLGENKMQLDIQLDEAGQDSQPEPEEEARRILEAEGEEQSGFDLAQYVAFDLYRGDEDSAPHELLKYEVVVSELAEERIFFKLRFENPKQVSIGSKKDLVVGTILDEAFFSSKSSSLAIPAGTTFSLTLPLMLEEAAIVMVEQAEETIKSTVQPLVTGQIILTLVLSVSLKQMWNLMNVLQVLTYARNFTTWPPFVVKVLEALIDAIYLEQISSRVLDFGQTKFEVAKSVTKDEYLKEQGIQDDSVVKNLGIFALGVGCIMLVISIYLLVRYVCYCKCCGKIITMVKNKLFFSGPYRYIIVGYLKLVNQFFQLFCLGLVTNLGPAAIAPYGIAIGFLLIWPLFSIYLLTKNHSKLHYKPFKRRHSSLYQGIRTDSFRALCYNAVFSARRFDLILMNAYFTMGSPLSGFQRSQYSHKIFTFLYIQICYLAYVHATRPHADQISNRLEFFNEYSLMLLAYAMLNFTKLGSQQNKETLMEIEANELVNTGVEYAACGVIFLMALINLGAMVKSSCNKIILNLKKRKAQKKAKAMSEAKLKKVIEKPIPQKTPEQPESYLERSSVEIGGRLHHSQQSDVASDISEVDVEFVKSQIRHNQKTVKAAQHTRKQSINNQNRDQIKARQQLAARGEDSEVQTGRASEGHLLSSRRQSRPQPQIYLNDSPFALQDNSPFVLEEGSTHRFSASSRHQAGMSQNEVSALNETAAQLTFALSQSSEHPAANPSGDMTKFTPTEVWQILHSTKRNEGQKSESMN